MSTLSWFQKPESRVSAHVVIDRDGTVFRCVADDRVAWHAGKSVLFGAEGCNAFSLGVELVDIEDDPYPHEQVDAAVEWVAEKCVAYAIALNRIVTHRDVSPGRKIDPGDDWDMRAFLLAVARHILA